LAIQLKNVFLQKLGSGLENQGTFPPAVRLKDGDGAFAGSTEACRLAAGETPPLLLSIHYENYGLRDFLLQPDIYYSTSQTNKRYYTAGMTGT
jgi:hypothetical protein